MTAYNANSVDPDQTPRSAESDLEVQCLQMSLLWTARHKWLKETQMLWWAMRLLYFITGVCTKRLRYKASGGL